MLDNFVHIMTTPACGCIVALFAHWLRNRNDKKKKATIVTPKNPLTTSDSEGIGVLCLITLLSRL
jgi:hypothetical protein